MTSEEITATVDPTIFASIMEKTSFSFSVSISNVTTNDKNTVISSSLSTLPVIINKAAYCNLKAVFLVIANLSVIVPAGLLM